MWYTLFKYLLFRPGVKLLLHPTLEGEQNIPRQGGAVLASNHLDIADTLALPALMRRRLTFPAKKELFEGRTLWGRIVAWFLTAVGMVPLDRSGGRASASGLGPIDQVLTDGGLAGIFPEGTRYKGEEGGAGEFKAGAFRIAVKTGAPVVPVAVTGARALFETNGNRCRPGSVRIKIMSPIQTAGMSKAEQKQLPDAVRQSILAALK